MSFLYVLLVCLDGEDVKPKWKQWLADKLDIKPKIEVKYIKPQVVKLHSRVEIPLFEIRHYPLNKLYMEQLKKRAIESVYNGILKEMIQSDLVTISQRKDIYDSFIFEGTCSFYKN